MSIEELDYYYVVYVCNGAQGMMVFPQERLLSGDENPDGFDFPQATEQLYKIHGAAVIIQHWAKVTRARQQQFLEIMNKIDNGRRQMGTPFGAIGNKGAH